MACGGEEGSSPAFLAGDKSNVKWPQPDCWQSAPSARWGNDASTVAGAKRRVTEIKFQPSGDSSLRSHWRSLR